MNKLYLYILVILASPASGQYYLRGEIKNEKSIALQNVKIFVHSAKANYSSGTSGSFGITVSKLYDSLTLSLEGYESQTIKVKTDVWQSIIMKVSATISSKNKPKLISITKDHKQATNVRLHVTDETYFQLVENEFVQAAKFPVTGFSLNVNKASYSNVRRFLNMQGKVPPDAVRLEELINYFNLHYRIPGNKEIFRIESQLTNCPWAPSNQLLFVNVSAKKLELDKIPPGNFVFLIDVSGSMDMPNRLPLLQAAFQMFVKNLRPQDKVSIVTYGGSIGIWMQPTSGSEKEKICKRIEELTAAGDTPGESAIRAAYKLAESTFIKNGNNRVILATDGDFNVGETTEKALEELILKQRSSGVYLTCLGVGMGNLKDSKLETLAKKGNGNYAYLDDVREAEKTLVKELTQNLYSVADDVSMHLKFNPNTVKEYRLIGFDNKKEAIADSSNDLEGGEVGSGNSTLAIFELMPTASSIANTAEEIATVTLKYKKVNDSNRIMTRYIIPQSFSPIATIDSELRFASSVALFGLKLKESKYVGSGDWEMVTALAASSADKSNYLQQEFIALVEKAKKIYPEKKKKKKLLTKN